MDADQPRASLRRSDTAEWKLWSLVAELANRLDPASWVLIGGQMVALHVHLSGATPRRTTTDVDVVADILGDQSAFHVCKGVAIDMVSKRSRRSSASICTGSAGRLAISI